MIIKGVVPYVTCCMAWYGITSLQQPPKRSCRLVESVYWADCQRNTSGPPLISGPNAAPAPLMWPQWGFKLPIIECLALDQTRWVTRFCLLGFLPHTCPSGSLLHTCLLGSLLHTCLFGSLLHTCLLALCYSPVCLALCYIPVCLGFYYTPVCWLSATHLFVWLSATHLFAWLSATHLFVWPSATHLFVWLSAIHLFVNPLLLTCLFGSLLHTCLFWLSATHLFVWLCSSLSLRLVRHALLFLWSQRNHLSFSTLMSPLCCTKDWATGAHSRHDRAKLV